MTDAWQEYNVLSFFNVASSSTASLVLSSSLAGLLDGESLVSAPVLSQPQSETEVPGEPSGSCSWSVVFGE